MRKILCGGAALLAVAGASFSVSAADRPIYKAPPIVLFDWTGWYIGGNAGYSWGRTRNEFHTSSATTVFQSSTTRVRGGQASAEIGYCLQFTRANPAWVGCLEARYDFPPERGRRTEISTNTIGRIDTTQKLDPFLIGPKLGAAIFDNRLFVYGAGGVAIGKVAVDAVASSTANGTEGQGSASRTKTGWFIGAGAEWMIDRHWGVKFEYDRVDLGGGIVDVINSAVTTNRVNFVTPAMVTISSARDNVISVAVNYHFGTR